MGGGGHGHGAHDHGVKIPDYKIYKVADSPQLMAVQRALAAKGLKDPWLRNEVWRYQGPSRGQKLVKMLTRGMGIGFIAAVLTTAVGFMHVPHHHHDEGHHHENEHH